MSCSGHDGKQFVGESREFKRALWAIIAINALMFIIEMFAGVAAGSQALKADALDFAADTATYGLSLAVIGMPLIRRARVALLKGFSLAAMGLGVFGMTAYQMIAVEQPAAEIIGFVGLLALLANLTSIVLLLKFRDGDANVRSVWLCSRNDAIGNVAVICTSGAVWLTASGWPDLVVAAIMASLFLKSAFSIINQALGELRSSDLSENAKS